MLVLNGDVCLNFMSRLFKFDNKIIKNELLLHHEDIGNFYEVLLW